MSTPPGSSPISAVLFDLDDTLLDWSGQAIDWQESTRHHVSKVHSYLSREGHCLPDMASFIQLYIEVLIENWDEAKKTWAGVHFGDVWRQSLSRLKLDLDHIDLNEIMLAYDWQPMPGVIPYDDAIPVLETLQNQGYKIGLITNSMFPMWMRDIELRAYRLLSYFDVRITSGDTGYMKPHPAIYQRALGLMGVPAEKAMFVGDRPANDIAGANESGLISVLINPPHLDRQLDDVQPDYTISCLTELLPILRGLQSYG